MISQSLFHFTSKLATLENILTSKSFRASYNIESVKEIYPNQEYLAYPMICFCDIPLKNIQQNHTSRYGKYGIGLTKSWGLKNLIQPITYRIPTRNYADNIPKYEFKSLIEANSNISESLNSLNRFVQQSKIIELERLVESLNRENSKAIDASTTLSFYLKPYYFENSKEDNYKDREWRYVPENAEFSFTPKKTEEVRKSYNNKYWKYPDWLLFEYTDVEHIIVPKKNDVERAIKMILDLNIAKKESYDLII